jgi:hypothetical protein
LLLDRPVDAAKLPREQKVTGPSGLAILFTMDSISSYEAASKHGGAAGEIIIRKSLEDAFQHFNIQLDIIRSDADFESRSPRSYDIIILDPWTWAAKGKRLAFYCQAFYGYMPMKRVS